MKNLQTVLPAIYSTTLQSIFGEPLRTNTVYTGNKGKYIVKIEDHGTVLYKIDRMTSTGVILEYTAVKYVISK